MIGHYIEFRRAMIAGMISLSALVLSGCDSKPQPATLAPSVTVEKYAVATILQGLVVGENGPAKVGRVKALSEKGEVLASAELNGNSRYSLELPAGTMLPILLAYYPSEDAAEAQRMTAAAVHRSISKYDINPASTRIAKQAKVLGGYTHKNLVRAAEESGMVPADNKTTAGFRGDPTTQYGGWH